MAKPKTWALVSNGVRARILRGLEDGDTRDPVELISKARSTHMQDFLTDDAGRSFSSGARGQRSKLEPGSDILQRDMVDFARETLGFLEQHHRAQDFDRLAIFAAPKMLGILRQKLPDALQEAVVLERSANLMGLPVPELRETVQKMLRSEPRAQSSPVPHRSFRRRAGS